MFTKPFSIAARNTLGKTERLKSRKLIGQLFDGGKSVNATPLRALYQIAEAEPGSVQAGFSVSSRHFRKATDRNRIKRLLRECYRTQKHPLIAVAADNKLQVSLFIIFTGRELPAFEPIHTAMQGLIAALEKRLTPAINR